MSSPRRVGLFFGGRSVEHEVSVTSARSVASALTRSGSVPVPIAVSPTGRWYSPELSEKILEDGRPKAELRGSEKESGRVSFEAGVGFVDLAIDVVFPLIHGWGGEDGRLQGLLDLAGLPYVGCGVTASAVSIDKSLTKRLLEAEGIPVVRGFEITPGDSLDAARERVATELGFPAFVKPARGGSSVGVSRVGEPEGLDAALRECWRYDPRALVERAVTAREIECAVLGNREPRAAVLGEIRPSNEFYDYAAKYVDDRSELLIPAPVEPETEAGIRAAALSVHRVLGLEGLARIDFLLDRKTGDFFCNEVNTLPGFTPISMFPKLWEASGLSYPELVARLIELALERTERESALRYER